MYVPKPGDLIFSVWMGQDEHNCEVMEFLGSTSRGNWTAANFYNKKTIYNFTLSPSYGDTLKWFCKFGIHRLSKKLKPKFSIDDIVEIEASYSSPVYPYTREPVLCKITDVRLKYDSRRKKCYLGYNFKILKEDKYSAQTLARLKSALTYVRESSIRKFINYNRFWDTISEKTDN